MLMNELKSKKMKHRGRKDAIVRVHARAALAELHAITKQFVDPGMKRPAAVFLSSHFS